MFRSPQRTEAPGLYETAWWHTTQDYKFYKYIGLSHMQLYTNPSTTKVDTFCNWELIC
jgi:hypothetical protein